MFGVESHLTRVHDTRLITAHKHLRQVPEGGKGGLLIKRQEGGIMNMSEEEEEERRLGFTDESGSLRPAIFKTPDRADL